ncbi:hypothetical protein N7452_003126 [Penicillium brevicompactum]|uniref:Protein SGT1 n=1 Tax=Penicillium brevicompactum TaxID=5074 RepID=A0A9W9QT76_PENBR|nr:hypothetical protein N7452_003126 [Penicillium brevicompactum]
MDAAKNADAAMQKSDFPLAIQKYTQALTELPRAAVFYIGRSTAFSRLKPEDGGPKYQDALDDAEIAVRLAVERGGHEIMLAAVMRRAISLFQLERFGDAEKLFNYVALSIENESTVPDPKKSINKFRPSVPTWVAKMKTLRDNKVEGDEKWVVNIDDDLSDIAIPTSEQLKAQLDVVLAKYPSRFPAPVKKEEDLSTRPVEIRPDWYETPQVMSVIFLLKNMTLENVEVDVQMSETSLVVKVPTPSGSIAEAYIYPLWAPIDPEQSTFVVKSSKIEVSLRKKTSGMWKNLMKVLVPAQQGAVPSGNPNSNSGADNVESSKEPEQHGKGPKDWDKVLADLDAEEKASSGSKVNASTDGAADMDDEEEPGDVDAFFKKLYAGADDDTRRAMIKSFTESQGTSLSTNWSDVGKGKVNPHE